MCALGDTFENYFPKLAPNQPISKHYSNQLVAPCLASGQHNMQRTCGQLVLKYAFHSEKSTQV